MSTTFAPTAAISLQSVTKSFGSKRAVSSVSFEVQTGQCYGLIGPNGAGKTTLFSMMCGFLFPTEGQLRILGVKPTEPGALKGKVGILPQDALLPPRWSVGELLTYWARLSHLDNPRAEARRVLECVQLTETWDVAAETLSHGMTKRVALAQALMGSPPVLLFDEPTAGLDPKIAAIIRNLIADLKGRHTVVVSSHNLHELEELCDATAILDRGQLVRSASIAEITQQAEVFRVRIARGEVPLDEIRAFSECRTARLEGDNVLCVEFQGSTVAAEDIITRVVALLAARHVLILEVWRGKRLEDAVLKLTQ